MKLTTCRIGLALTVLLAPIHAQEGEEPAPEVRPGPQVEEVTPAVLGGVPPALTGLTGWVGSPSRTWEHLSGKVVLVGLWDSAAPKSLEDFEYLAELHAVYRLAGLEVLSVHRTSAEVDLKRVVRERKLPWMFALDGDGKLFRALQSRRVPTYFVVGRNGKLRGVKIDKAKLNETVTALLKEPAKKAGNWPEKVRKRLYAKNDLRGQLFPDFHVAKWITKPPGRKGKVLLIEFWSTTSPACLEYLPQLNLLHRIFAKDVSVVAVTDEEEATVEAFRKQHKPRYALATDPEARMRKVVGVERIPYVVIVSTDGVVRWQGYPNDPADPLGSHILRQIIEADPALQVRRTEEAVVAKKKADERKRAQEEARVRTEEKLRQEELREGDKEGREESERKRGRGGAERENSGTRELPNRGKRGKGDGRRRPPKKGTGEGKGGSF